MNRGDIRVGALYAVANERPKGYSDLTFLDAWCGRVKEVGVFRYTDDVRMIADGVRMEQLLIDDNNELSVVATEVVIPRHVLMPWGEYSRAREERAVKAAQEKAERERKDREFLERMEVIQRELAEYGIEVQGNWTQESICWNSGYNLAFSEEGIRKLLDGIGERVYNIVKDMS
jgi:hypothetical protein